METNPHKLWFVSLPFPYILLFSCFSAAKYYSFIKTLTQTPMKKTNMESFKLKMIRKKYMAKEEEEEDE